MTEEMTVEEWKETAHRLMSCEVVCGSAVRDMMDGDPRLGIALALIVLDNPILGSPFTGVGMAIRILESVLEASTTCPE